MVDKPTLKVPNCLGRTLFYLLLHTSVDFAGHVKIPQNSEY